MLCQLKMEELTEKKTWFTFTQAVTNIYIGVHNSCGRRPRPDDEQLSSPVLRGGGHGDVCLLTRQGRGTRRRVPPYPTLGGAGDNTPPRPNLLAAET